MEIFADDPKRTPEDPKAILIDSRRVTKGDTIVFNMVDEGGAVAIFAPVR
jgi:hypothetical protein